MSRTPSRTWVWRILVFGILLAVVGVSLWIQLADTASAAEALQSLRGIQGLMEKTKHLGLGASEPDAVRAGAGEFILEGLYAHKRISRNEEAGFTAGERRREPPDEGKIKPKRQYQ